MNINRRPSSEDSGVPRRLDPGNRPRHTSNRKENPTAEEHRDLTMEEQQEAGNLR